MGLCMRHALQLGLLGVAAFFSMATSRVGPGAATSIDPPDGETAVSPDTVIEVSFDGELDSVSDGDIVLVELGTGTRVAADLVLGNYSARLVPTAPLPEGELEVTVSEDLTFSGPLVSRFSTLSDPRIRAARFDDSLPSPAREHQLLVSFSQDMNPATLDEDRVVVWGGRVDDPQTIAPIDGVVLTWLGGRLHELRVELPPDVVFPEVEILAGVEAADGTPMAPATAAPSN